MQQVSPFYNTNIIQRNGKVLYILALMSLQDLQELCLNTMLGCLKHPNSFLSGFSTQAWEPSLSYYFTNSLGRD